MHISRKSCIFAPENYEIMKKLFFIVSILAFGMALNAQSLSTGVQYVGAAAEANAAQKQQAAAQGLKAPVKVAFQMDIEIGGRARWGYIPTSSTGIAYEHEGGVSFLNIGGNNTVTGGPSANVNLGVRINNSYFIGVGAQFNANFGKTKATLGTTSDLTVHVMNLCLPIYGAFKVYIPRTSGVCPYFDLGIGGYLPDWYQLTSKNLADYNLTLPEGFKATIEGEKIKFQADKGGFYLHAAVGIDNDHLQVSAGYELTTSTEDVNTRLYHNIFAKIGFRIGG